MITSEGSIDATCQSARTDPFILGCVKFIFKRSRNIRTSEMDVTVSVGKAVAGKPSEFWYKAVDDWRASGTP